MRTSPSSPSARTPAQIRPTLSRNWWVAIVRDHINRNPLQSIAHIEAVTPGTPCYAALASGSTATDSCLYR